MRQHIFSVSIADSETRQTIKNIYERYRIVLEQHGAVGWIGLEKYFSTISKKPLAVSLETAHPAKFPEEIEKLLGFTPELPASMKGIDQRQGGAVAMTSNYDNFKNYLQNNLKIKE
jgi:threonine synthase